MSEEQITALRKKVEAARQEKARREASADQARATLAEVDAQLRELGHDSPESALEEAKKLREGTAKTVALIEEKLAEASA